MSARSASIAGVEDWRDRRGACTAKLFAPGRLTRAAARWRRLELDRALAAGGDPAESALLAARAEQLLRPAERRRLAAVLEHVTTGAVSDRRRSGTPPLREAIRSNRHELLRLAAVLRDDGPLYAGGVAILELAIIDGTGPAYTDRTGAALARQLRRASVALAG